MTTCPVWNGTHSCRRDADHDGDHVCTCRDRWNQDAHDVEDCVEFEHERPAVEERCS